MEKRNDTHTIFTAFSRAALGSQCFVFFALASKVNCDEIMKCAQDRLRSPYFRCNIFATYNIGAYLTDCNERSIIFNSLRALFPSGHFGD